MTSESTRNDSKDFIRAGFSPFRATALANIWGAHSGASLSRTISLQGRARTLARSVRDLQEVEARFTFCGFPDGNVANFPILFAIVLLRVLGRKVTLCNINPASSKSMPCALVEQALGLVSSEPDVV